MRLNFCVESNAHDFCAERSSGKLLRTSKALSGVGDSRVIVPTITILLSCSSSTWILSTRHDIRHGGPEFYSLCTSRKAKRRIDGCVKKPILISRISSCPHLIHWKMWSSLTSLHEQAVLMQAPKLRECVSCQKDGQVASRSGQLG